MKVENYVTLEFLSRSTNEGFARSAVRKRRNAPAHRQSRPTPP